MQKSLTKAESAGFCFGVSRAVNIVNDLLSQGKKVCTLGPIIHNMEMVEELREKGCRPIDSVDELGGDEILVIRSHGVPKSVVDDLERRVKLRTKEVVERNQLITAKDARIDDLENRIKLRTKEVVERSQLITAKDARIDEYVRQLADLRNSWAYRLGRMLTWPARKLRSLIGG